MNSDFSDDQKYYLYSKEYSTDDNVKILSLFNIKSDNYLNTIKFADDIKQNYQGDTYTSYRKNQIQQYINGLNATVLEKVILFKQTGYSITNYKNMVYQYIESLPLTAIEKRQVWERLY